MSTKTLIVLGIVAAAGYALTRNEPAVRPGATSADSAAVAHAGVSARFEYGIGTVGSKLVGTSVRHMVESTEQTLVDLRPGIKSTKGPDGVRAQKYAQKIARMDSVALVDLEYARPVKAVRGAMSAKSLVDAVRDQIERNE